MKTLERLRGIVERPDVTIAYRLRPAPYGGSNQFLRALRGELRRRGLRVSDVPAGSTRACLLHSYLVDVPDLRARLSEQARIVHRIDGPIGVYRGEDDGTDRRIVEINQALADATILQSRYSLETHRALGLELRNPTVIRNAVDPEVFYPAESRPLGSRLRLIATSWSDNPNKGGETYRRLAGLLDPDRYELTFVGRASTELPGATVIPPVDSETLAGYLREHDAFVTASLHEACSNAVLEALACGLPVLYVRSGANEELVGAAGYGFDEPEEIPALLERLSGDYEARRSAISIPSLAEVADRYLEVMGLE